jgi:hypothetical protein
VAETRWRVAISLSQWAYHLIITRDSPPGVGE